MRSDGPALATHPGSFPVDPGFPQLELAVDAGRMREVFREHLKPADGRSLRILDCTPFRFRCRQSTSRCVLQYTLRLEDPDTGRRWDQWVTGLVYADRGEAERLWSELAAGDAAREVPERWRSFEPVSFIRELDMVVEVFPFDRRLPQLGVVLDVALRDLEPQLVSRLGPGRSRAGPPTVEPSRYRTEMGAVFRYALPVHEAATGRDETLRCYVKVYRNGRGEETFERLRSWASLPRPDYRVVRPIGYWGALRTMVLEEAPGTSLRELLAKADDPVGAVRAAARATAAFNRDEPGNARGSALADQLDQLRRAAALVEWACPELRNEVRTVVAAVAANLREVAPAPIHGDLKPDHVFLCDGRVTFVDLDSVALGDPVRDPAHFCSYLLARVGLDTLTGDRARALAGEYIDSYFSLVPRAWRGRFAFHCAGALIEVAGGIFRHQRPGWREGATMAVEEALDVLAGAGR